MATASKRKEKTPLKSDPVLKDFQMIESMTDKQGDMIDYFDQGMNVLAIGSAGTGKTFVATALALKALTSGRAKKIIFVRSAVATRDIGFLPGNEHEKMAVFENIYIEIVNKLLGRGDAYSILKQKGFIDFQSSSFLRGTTWDDTIVIGDEIQNFSPHEVNTLMTRFGHGTRALLCGDIVQSDLGKAPSGFRLLMQVAPHLSNDFGIIKFSPEDIVRGRFVKEWIIACEKHSDFYKLAA